VLVFYFGCELLPAAYKRLPLLMTGHAATRVTKSSLEFIRLVAAPVSHQSEVPHMKRNASAIWNGGLKDGKGALTTDSGVLSNTQYSFATRFENGIGTNPEELIAAAHAGCFSMQLSALLEKAGHTAASINTTASVTLDKADGGFAITAIHLTVKAKVPGANQQQFDEAANTAKAGCPVSKVLRAEITMTATLES
jgi:osmotically inducible protein OsmC